MFDNGSLLRRRKRFKTKLGARAQENPNGNTTGSNNESSSYENNQFEGDEEFEDDFDTNMNDDNYSNDNEPENFDLNENQHQTQPKTAITGHINSIDAEMLMMKKKQDILPYLDNAGIRNDLMLSEHEKQQINMFLALQKTNELRSFEQASPLLSQMMFGFKQNPLVNPSLLVNAASIQQQHATTVKNLNINALPNSSSSPISSVSSSSSSSPSSTSSSSLASSETQNKQAPSSSKASSSFSIDSLIGHGSGETSKTALNKLNTHSLAIKKSNKQHTAKNLKEKLAKLNEKSKSTSFESSKSQESANNSNLSNGSSSRESSRSRNGDEEEEEEEAIRSSNNSSRCASPAELSEQHKTNTSSSGVKAQGLFNPLGNSSSSYVANPYLAQQHASMLSYFNQSYLNSQQNPNLTQAEAAIRLRNSLSLFYSTQLNNQSGNQLGLPLDCSSTSISSLSSTSSSSSSSTSSISNSSNTSNSKQNDPVSLAAAIASASNFPHNLIQASPNNFKQLNNQNALASASVPLTPNNNQQQNLFKMFNEALLMRAAAAVSTQQHQHQQNNQNLSAINSFLSTSNNTSLSLNQNSNVNQTSNVNELQNVNFSNILPLFLPMHS